MGTELLAKILPTQGAYRQILCAIIGAVLLFIFAVTYAAFLRRTDIAFVLSFLGYPERVFLFFAFSYALGEIANSIGGLCVLVLQMPIVNPFKIKKLMHSYLEWRGMFDYKKIRNVKEISANNKSLNITDLILASQSLRGEYSELRNRRSFFFTVIGSLIFILCLLCLNDKFPAGFSWVRFWSVFLLVLVVSGYTIAINNDLAEFRLKAWRMLSDTKKKERDDK